MRFKYSCYVLFLRAFLDPPERAAMSRRSPVVAPVAAPSSPRVADAFPSVAEGTEGSHPRKPRRHNPHESPPGAAPSPSPDGTGDPMTLWNLVQQGIDVFCWCNRCNHHAVLPVRVLAAHMEPSTPVPAVAARVVCSGCGGREVATRPAWPPRGPVSRHSSAPTSEGAGAVPPSGTGDDAS